MLVSNPSSCFIDACELAFGADAWDLDHRYRSMFPDATPEVDGYHPHVVNLLLLDAHGVGMSKVDCIPTKLDGTALGNPQRCMSTITSWFSRSKFGCIAEGLDANDSPHAIAWVGGSWIDPKQPDVKLAEPSIRLQSLWVLSI